VHGFAVRAQSEEQARKIAQHSAERKNRSPAYTDALWHDPKSPRNQKQLWYPFR
jgi:hypothetical protein